MIGEVIYTSAKSGLRPGTSGFCTVAATKGLSKRDQLALESLSGYEFAFGISDPRADSNPTCFVHTTVAVGEGSHDVISRIGFAGADHTGRSNKIAHHLLLESTDRAPEGPAALMAQIAAEAKWVTSWDSAPQERELWHLPRAVPASRSPKGWERSTGDAGWGGVLARAFRARPNSPAFVVFQPGTDVLALFRDSMAVLPTEDRWRICFSTYFTAALSPDRPCHWRAVLSGSSAVALIQRHPDATVIDLTKPLPPLVEDEFVRAARTGEVVRAPVTLAAPIIAPSESVARKPRKQLPASRGERPLELLPELEALKARSTKSSVSQSSERSGGATWAYFAAAGVVLAAIVLTPILTADPTPPPITAQTLTTGSRAPALQTSPSTGHTPGRALTHPVSVPPDLGSVSTSTTVVESTATDSSATNPVPTTESSLPVDPEQPATIEPTPVPFTVTREENARDPTLTSTAVVVTSVPGSWEWPLPDVQGWEAIDGRAGRYLKLVADGEGRATIKSIDSKPLGSVSLERRQGGVVARVVPSAEHPDPERRDAILRAFVVELRAQDGRIFLLPLRSRTTEGRDELIGWVGQELQAPSTIVCTVPPPGELPGVEEVPMPLRVSLGMTNEAKLVTLSEDNPELSKLGVTCKLERSSITIAVEPRLFAVLRRGSVDDEGIAPLVAAFATSVAAIRSTTQVRDAAQREAEQRRETQDRVRQAQALESARKAQRDLDKLERDFSENWLRRLYDLEVRLNGTRFVVVDPWGLPLGSVRYQWIRGWTSKHLDDALRNGAP